MRKLLWIGDAACPSGFARCTHYICDVLRHHWEVSVLGLNYRGDPHEYPYPIYPSRRGGAEDLFGIERLPELMVNLRPDVVVIQNDPWNLPAYMKVIPNTPTIAIMAVDGKNVQGRPLNGLSCAIFWTEFGANETVKGGYRGPYAIAPLGVDLDIYKPMDKLEARSRFFRPEDLPMMKNAFIVGNVNRNQPRKRMDLTVSFFAEWVRTRQIDNAYLALHVAPTGDVGFDVQQLMAHYGMSNKLILSSPDTWVGVPESTMNNNYNCFDVGLTTSQGEGWGLTTMEMMACGVPQIVPDWSALGEWPGDTVVKVPCSEIAVTLGGINIIGGVMDRRGAIEALDKLYHARSAREEYGRLGMELVNRPEYRWRAVGERFNEAIEAAIDTLGVRMLVRT